MGMNEYTIERLVNGVAKMGDGTEQPATTAIIRKNEQFITSVRLNGAIFCLPGETGKGIHATDAQIVRAVLGDEDIFSGAASFPEHHDTVISAV